MKMDRLLNIDRTIEKYKKELELNPYDCTFLLSIIDRLENEYYKQEKEKESES